MARRRETTQPFLDHDTLTQAQQAKHLDVKPETLLNLGHPCSVADIAKHPLGSRQPTDYEGGAAARVINEKRSVGVYGKFADPKDGTSRQENLSRWSGYASANSYDGHHHVGGVGRAPSNPDSRPDRRATQKSDGYLESTKNWPNFEYGSDSGPGRIEKQHKR